MVIQNDKKCFQNNAMYVLDGKRYQSHIFMLQHFYIKNYVLASYICIYDADSGGFS